MWRAGGSSRRARAIWAGTAQSRARESVVFFHRSHIRQRKGHSRLVRKIVATSSTAPAAVRSGSTKKACGRHGSTALLGPRRARTAASSKTGSSFVDRMERSPVGHFLPREQVAEHLTRRGAVVERALGKDRHLEAGNGPAAAR